MTVIQVCLIPLQTKVRDLERNLAHLTECLALAVPYHPDLVCFPECTLTGYLYEEDDLKRFAEPIPGVVTNQLGQLAQAYEVYICFGMLELTEAGVYNTGLLLNKRGEIILKHRKVAEKPPFVNGDQIDSVHTELGRLGILICADLFDESARANLDPTIDLLLVPMSRGFDGLSPDMNRWVDQERGVYLEAVETVGATTVIVNALVHDPDNASFGGALVVDAHGNLLAEAQHGTDEMLFWKLHQNGS